VLFAVRGVSALRLSEPPHLNVTMPWGGFDYILSPTMPKVGSKTLIFSLGGIPYLAAEEQYPPIIKAHSATVSTDFLQKIPAGKKVLIITSVRNSFFQQESLFFEGVMNSQMVQFPSWDRVQKMSMGEVVAEFEKAVHPSAFHNWFSSDLKSITGVNVLEHEFNFRSKTLLVQHTENNVHITVLVLRVEDAMQWEYILNPILPGFKMKTSNQAEDKSCAELYKQFKESYRFPSSAVELISSSENMHFYTQAEQQAILERVAMQTRLTKTIDDNFVEVGTEALYLGDLDVLGSESNGRFRGSNEQSL
jgi:hypothetical protein